MTATFYSDTDIYVSEALLSEEQHRFEGLLSQQARLDELNRLPIDFNQTFAFLAVSNCDRIFLETKIERKCLKPIVN